MDFSSISWGREEINLVNEFAETQCCQVFQRISIVEFGLQDKSFGSKNPRWPSFCAKKVSTINSQIP